MRWNSLIVCVGAVAVVGCGLMTPATPEETKEAARRVLSMTCGNERDEPGFHRASRIVENAGADLVPVLAELVADETTSLHFVRNATDRALKHPPSEAFRTALRARRDHPDYKPHGKVSLFDNFAQHGDASDLAWKEAVTADLDDASKAMAAEPIAKYGSDSTSDAQPSRITSAA